MEPINKNHITINRTHIATITIDEHSKHAKLGIYPIINLSDPAIIYFKNLLVELQTLITSIDSDIDNNQLYEKLEKDLLNAERYLQHQASLTRIQSYMLYCTNAIKKEEYNGIVYDITSYSNSYEGKEKIEYKAQESYIQDMDNAYKENLEKFKYYLDAKPSDKDQIYLTINDMGLFLRNYSIAKIENEYNKKRNSVIKRRAEDFCKDMLQRLALYAYELTIKEITNIKDIKAYSSKKIGWQTYRFNIGDEYEATINSNFGYGNSSYFYLIISFRGIKLTPYSQYVKYNRVNIIEIHRYTISAHLYETEWGRMFEYIVESYNLALDSVDDFIDKYFIAELDAMVSTLEEWFYLPKDKEEFIIEDTEVYSINNSSKYCINFNRDSIDFEYFQLEKIAGSLEFIDSIQAIKEVTNVQSYIDRILYLNTEILQIAERRVELLKEEIADAKIKLRQHEKRKNLLQRKKNSKIEIREKEITNAYSTINKLYEISEEDDQYSHLIDLPKEPIEPDNSSLYLFARLIELKENPEFEQLEEELVDENIIIEGINSVIYENKQWKSKYTDCIVIISKYFKLNRKKKNS